MKKMKGAQNDEASAIQSGIQVESCSHAVERGKDSG
jgi:hypothetical protein